IVALTAELRANPASISANNEKIAPTAAARTTGWTDFSIPGFSAAAYLVSYGAHSGPCQKRLSTAHVGSHTVKTASIGQRLLSSGAFLPKLAESSARNGMFI